MLYKLTEQIQTGDEVFKVIELRHADDENTTVSHCDTQVFSYFLLYCDLNQ